MPRIEPRAVCARIAAALLLAAACLHLGGCHPEGVPAEEKSVTVRLHDSLSRLPRVEVLILSAADTSTLVGKVWDGPLENPSSLPTYRLSDQETRPLAVRVRGYDSAGVLIHDQLITKSGGRQVVSNLLPPLPNPLPTKPAPSVRLSDLAVFPGTLSPAFDSLKGDYRVELPFEQESIVLTATSVTAAAAVLIEGIPAVSGVATKPFNLQVGSNELGIRVTAGDSTRLYSLKVDRAQQVDPPDTASPSDWDPAYLAWQYRAEVNVNVLQLAMGHGDRVEDFPLAIKLNRENFVFSQAGAGGVDLRLVRKGKPVDYEVARWDSASGLAEVWVRLDTVRFDTAFAPLTLYWGNAAAASVSQPGAVFPRASGHAGVWHLAESGKGVEGEYKDATGRFPGRGTGPLPGTAPQRVEGAVGFGQSFKYGNTPSAIGLPRSFASGSSAQWTIQCWLKVESTGAGLIFSKVNPAASQTQRIRILLEGPGQLRLIGMGDTLKTNVSLPKQLFVHLGIVYAGGLVKLFLDGKERETLAWTPGTVFDGDAVIGAGDMAAADQPFKGVIDEFWVASLARSPVWMRLSHENQKPGSYLVVLGSPASRKAPVTP